MPIAAQMFLFSKDTRRFLARLENQTNSDPSKWKRLEVWINKKGENIAFTPVTPPTPVASISLEECNFHIKNKKKIQITNQSNKWT